MAKAVVAMLVAVSFVVAAIGASADDCDTGNLAPCFPAIMIGSKPSEKCCSRLRDQQGCLCQYAHNPPYSRYLNSPHGRDTLYSCGTAIPSC